MNENNKYSPDPQTPGKNRRALPNVLEKGDSRTPRPPIVSPVCNDQGETAKKDMEENDMAPDVGMQEEAAERVNKMDLDGPTEDNEAVDAPTAAEDEEAQKGRDQAADKAMAKRIRDLSVSGGREDSEEIQEDNNEGSDDEVENSAWAKSLLPVKINQRKRNK